MRYLLLLIFLVSCSVTANRKGDELTLSGFGAQSASWEKDGEKYSISKSEPVKIPDAVLTR